MFSKKINELVSQDSVFAWVLHFFGISFYKYSDYTLDQLCEQKGISKETFISQIESFSQNMQLNDQLVDSINEYPIDLIIEYLKHTHHRFVKHRLPYLSDLINALDDSNFGEYPEARDLKFVFPIFVRDFIEHIYEEEDELFGYLTWIQAVLAGKIQPTTYVVNQKTAQSPIQKHALEHEAHTSGLEGIKNLTQNFSIGKEKDLLLEVICTELQAFDKELHVHASIEDEIFFPKALVQEQKLIKKFTTKFNLN